MESALLQLREILPDLAQGVTVVVQFNGDNSISALAIVVLAVLTALAVVALIWFDRRE